MSQTILFLGPVAFQDFEVASGVSYGGSQRLAVHDLPAGGRVIDALGADEGRITIEGIMSGESATDRVRLLSAMRSAGDALPMTWDVFFYTVIIQSFQAEFRSPWWIPFRLTCAVLRDEASTAVQGVVSLAASVAADIGAAIDAAPASVDLSASQAAVAQPDASIRGTAVYNGSVAALSQSQAVLNARLVSTQASIDTGAVFGAGTAQSGIGAISSATASCGQLAALTVASAYTGRALTNLRLASS